MQLGTRKIGTIWSNLAVINHIGVWKLEMKPYKYKYITVVAHEYRIIRYDSI